VAVLLNGKKELGVINKQQQQICGFSLVEVVVAMLVVAIAILGLVKMQIFLEQKSEYARMGLAALQIAENDMQYVQSLAFASISGATGSISRSDGTYDWVRTYKTVMSGSAKQTQVTVTWSDRQGEKQSLALSTMRSKFN